MIKRLAFIPILFASAAMLLGIEGVNLKVTKKDGSVKETPVKLEKINDTTSRLTIKASDIGDDVSTIDVLADNAKAQKGEEGFWVLNRGLLGYFNKDNGRYSTSKAYVYLPYYAMKTPQETFIGIIDGMRFEFEVIVEVKEGKYSVYPRWHISNIGFKPYEDIVITYYTLPSNADYNQMAKTYRKHKFASNPKIKPLKKRFKTQPYLEKMAMSVPVRMGFAGKPFNRKKDSVNFYPRGGKPFKDDKYGINAEREEYAVRARNFEDGIKTLEKMKAMGMDDIAVCVTGWQAGGYDARCPTSFPVCEEAGGEAALKKLIKAGQDMGYIMDGHSNYTDAFTCSPEWSPDNISKSPDGKLELNGAWSGGRAYNLCLKNAQTKFINRDIPKIADLGFRGAHYIDVFTAVYPYRCCDPKHPGNRKQMGEIQDEIAQMCREKFGGFASECGFDHFIDKVDYINYVTAPMRSKYVYKSRGMAMVDTFVPFWELVYHDIVLSNPDKITQEVLSQDNNLTLVEFGGRPIFYSVSDRNIEGIKKAYDQFMKLRHLQLEEMKSHKKISEGVFEIKYGNGDTIVVNRTDTPYAYDGETVEAKNFKLIKPTLWKRVKMTLGGD